MIRTRRSPLANCLQQAQVLVVDASPSDQRLIIETAVEAGAERTAIRCVPTLAEARRALTEGPVDVILLDLSLPDAVRLEGVAVLAAAAPEVPLVVVTGQPADSLVYAAMAEGADEHLCKNGPDPGRLLDVFLRALEHRRALPERRFPGLSSSVLDSVEAAMAVLDGTGRILVVNRAWSVAAVAGGATPETTGVGVNYLAVCDRAVGSEAPSAAAAAAGIRSVLHGVGGGFSLDYRCDDGDAERWFCLRVSPLGELGGGALVSHVDVTELKVAEHRLRGDDPRLHALYDDSAPIFALLGVDGTVLHVSDSTTRLLGLRPDERIGRHAFSTLDPTDFELARTVFASVLAMPGRSQSVTLRALDGAGRHRELDLVVMNLLEDPSVQAVVVSGCDVTEARLTQIASRLESTLLQRLPAGVVVTDDRSHVVYWNDQAAALYGYSADEALGRPITELDIGLQDPALAAAVRETVLAAGRWEGEFDAVRKDGSLLAVQAVVERVDDDEIGFHGIVGATVDISARRQLEDDLAFQALHDPLTGLPNRRLFIDHLEHAVARNVRNGTRAAVLFIDLDDFKQVNDQIGHAGGDAVLLAVGELIQGVLRAGDLVARLGGDEFVVCCSDITDLTEVDTVAARVLQVMAVPFRADGASLVLSASIGVALSGPSSHADGIMRNADVAMYAAKDAGKGRVEVFDDGMHESVRRRHQLARELREGMNAGQILTLFQPEVTLASGELFGFEALARWALPNEGSFRRTLSSAWPRRAG